MSDWRGRRRHDGRQTQVCITNFSEPPYLLASSAYFGRLACYRHACVYVCPDLRYESSCASDSSGETSQLRRLTVAWSLTHAVEQIVRQPRNFSVSLCVFERIFT